MLGLIILIAIAWTCAKAFGSATRAVSAKHKKRMTKAAKKKGNKAGSKAGAWAATAATFTGSFAKAFISGWKREWPKAKERAAARFDKTRPAPVEVGDDIAKDSTPRPVSGSAPKSGAKPATDRAVPAPTKPALVLVKPDTSDTTPEPITATAEGDKPMALATIPEITGVNTLKSAVARSASEAGVTAEEASAMALRAQDEMAAIEAMIEQAAGLEFGDDGGTLQELAALRDMCVAAVAAAQALQKAMVDKAAIASQSSKNIHDRHSHIQEAVAAQGGRMASKQAYTADV